MLAPANRQKRAKAVGDGLARRSNDFCDFRPPPILLIAPAITEKATKQNIHRRRSGRQGRFP